MKNRKRAARRIPGPLGENSVNKTKEKLEESKIHKYWSTFFGISIREMNLGTVKVVRHQGLKGYHGAWVFKRKSSHIISVPDELLEEIIARTKNISFDDKQLLSKEQLDSIFESRITKIIGPTFQGYYDRKNIEGEVSSNVTVLNQVAHKRQIEEISNSGDEKGWYDSGIAKNQKNIYGFINNGKILSIANYKIVAKQVGFIGVYTAPEFRGQGFGKQVVKLAMKDLISSGNLVLYQTLMSNKFSVKLAKDIGIVEYGKNIAIRFK